MLARSYANGILVDRNPIRAYAYYLASERAARSVIPPSLADTVRAKYAAGLSASEMKSADQLGREIYQDCCAP